MNCRRVLCAGVLCLVVGAACRAQVAAGWLVSVDSVVSPSNPVAVIRVSAWFDRIPEVAELFAGGRFDFAAAEGRYLHTECFLTCVSPGRVEGSVIRGIGIAQFHFPPQFPGNPANPIPVFTATWTTDSFARRSVPLWTSTSFLHLFQSMRHSGAFAVPRESIVEGAGRIRVVPAAPAIGPLLMMFAVARRRAGARVCSPLRSASSMPSGGRPRDVQGRSM